MKRHDGPATWESKVRGLMLGLALGDAIGSKRSDIPATGTLEAGAATQLAAWTAEGLLRSVTRFGGEWALNNHVGAVQDAYGRWATLRSEQIPKPEWPQATVHGGSLRGWLLDVPAMAAQRGSSPSTLKAILTGQPTHSHGCQGLLRTLPIAALAGPRGAAPDNVIGYACKVAEITHQHPRGRAAVQLAAAITVMCLREDRSVPAAIRAGMAEWIRDQTRTQADAAFQHGTKAPCVPQTLERLAPDKSAASALAGGIYVALSFPEADTVADALEFAGWAPDGDSVATVAGAFLGAVHGYEALPVALTSRLELGWVMDRLAIDLARQAVEDQAGTGWKSDDPDPDPAADPWWDTKYPGV